MYFERTLLNAFRSRRDIPQSDAISPSEGL